MGGLVVRAIWRNHNVLLEFRLYPWRSRSICFVWSGSELGYAPHVGTRRCGSWSSLGDVDEREHVAGAFQGPCAGRPLHRAEGLFEGLWKLAYGWLLKGVEGTGRGLL